MLIFIVILASTLGLSYGYYEGGFFFSSKICLFAGLTLIMPTLFNFKLRDVKLLLKYKLLVVKNLFLNFLALPFIALAIGLLTDNFGIASGLFLLSVLGGGGMVMHWIKKTEADTSIGFILLFINLLLVSLSLLLLHYFGVLSSSFFGESYDDIPNVSNFSQTVINLLIIIPFIASRFIMLVKPLVRFIEKVQKYISRLSIFIIIFYLFGLQNSQMLFDLYDFEPELILVAFIAVFTFYLMSFFVSQWIFDLNSQQEKAAFWHSMTRYITLALVISTFTLNTFGVSMILPLMLAYIIQIPFAIYMDKKVFV